MDVEEFRKRGCEMVEFIATYMTSLKSYRVTPEVTPGYLRDLLPDHAPRRGDNWEDIMQVSTEQRW